jgi:hypothetical protein
MKISKFIVFLVLCSSFLLLLHLNFALAATYDSSAFEANYSSDTQSTQDPTFIVSVLKYSPYPVNSGDWFDLWIKVQNIVENDALNATFELQPAYPFSSNDTLIRSYGLIFGRVNAFKVDQTYGSSQVILKYRVKVADNAPSGSSNLKFSTKTNGNQSAGLVYDLPIEIFSTQNQEVTPTVIQDNSSAKWIYGIVGFICGVFLIIIINILRAKSKVTKSHSH